MSDGGLYKGPSGQALFGNGRELYASGSNFSMGSSTGRKVSNAKRTDGYCEDHTGEVESECVEASTSPVCTSGESAAPENADVVGSNPAPSANFKSVGSSVVERGVNNPPTQVESEPKESAGGSADLKEDTRGEADTKRGRQLHAGGRWFESIPTDQSLVDYLNGLRPGERVIETGRSCIEGLMGTIYHGKQWEICVLWDANPNATPSGRMGTSVTGGARRVFDAPQ